MMHTHAGYRPHTGYVHCGAKLWGHRLQKAGRCHALTGGPIRFTALCGETVDLCARFDEFGDQVQPNVRPVADGAAGPVTCKRCLRLAVKTHANYWTEREAGADVNPRRCIHDVPLNVFCGKCER